MAHIRIRSNGRIQFDMYIFGARVRGSTNMVATPQNLNNAKAILKRINAENRTKHL